MKRTTKESSIIRLQQQIISLVILILLSSFHSDVVVHAQVSTSLGEPCLAVVKDIFEEDRRELLCQTPSGMLYVVPSVDDDWIGQKIMSGELVSGEVLLDIAVTTLVNRQTETLVMTEEPTFLQSNDDESGSRNLLLLRQRELQQQQQLLQMRRSGEKTVLAVRVVASNSETTHSAEEISHAIFGGPSDFVNLKSQYYACSHGKLNFQKRPDLNGLTTNIRNGVVTIKVNLPIEVGHPIMVNAVSEILIREFGITRSKIADHVMYCLPKGTLNGVAYAIMNRGLSVYNDKLCTSVSTQMHEVGHNLNLGHSAMNEEEYGDQSGMMGYSYPHSEVPKMCFNAAKTYQLEWFRDKSISYTPGRGVWSYDQTFTIVSMVDYRTTKSGQYVIVQLTQPNLDNKIFSQNYYLGMNAAKGFNSGVRSGKDQVLVFEKPMVDGTESKRLADLSAGQSFTISNFNDRKGDKLVITIISITVSTFSNTEAQVRIQLHRANNNLPRPTRSPTPKPTNGRGVGGRNPTLNAPVANSNPASSPSSCGRIMADCDDDSDCCYGYSCRRLSTDGPDLFYTVCRAVAKNDKNKLPRANINWWKNRRKLRGDDIAAAASTIRQELEDDEQEEEGAEQVAVVADEGEDEANVQSSSI